MAASHYENFPVASWILGGRRRHHVAAVYAFARTADDLADEPDYPEPGVTPEKRLANLDQWQSHLTLAFEGRASHPAFVALSATARELGLPKNLFEDLLSAFRQDVMKSRYENLDEVRDYARRSANPVGRLVLRIWGITDPRADACSDAICSALQLVNFWQDVSKDYVERDRIYLPRDRMVHHGVSETELRAGPVTAGYRNLLEEMNQTAAQLFEAGRPLPSMLPFPLSLWLRWVWLGGTAIGRRLRLAGYDVFSRRPVLTGPDMVKLLLRGLFPLGGRPALPSGRMLAAATVSKEAA
ncbi:MAG: squalene synthase HpnC [Deltaproteobacteria bacterium]|nr:squalene synthase HpnC [Deltaproteobacteria bacterium]